MSAAQSTASASQPSAVAPAPTSASVSASIPVPASESASAPVPAPAPNAAPVPETFVSTFKPKPAPSAEAKAATARLPELRQLTLENGRIIDLPSSVLQEPVLKPAEFFNLQHYFGAHHGEPVNLSACETVDEALEVLADEIEAIRLMMYGYAVNFKRYVDRFEEAHDELRAEVLSLAESYDGLSKLIMPAQRSARDIESKFIELNRKIASLPASTRRPPPKFSRHKHNGATNPPLSAEENKTIKERERVRFEQNAAARQVVDSASKLADAALIKDIMQPPRPAPKPPAVHPRPKLPFTHELHVKVNKVVDEINDARQELNVVDKVTSHGLVVLRYLEEDALKDTQELEEQYDAASRAAHAAGKVSQSNERRHKAWDKWADKCAEDAAAASAPPNGSAPPDGPAASDASASTEASAPPDAPGAQKEAATSETQERPASPRAQAAPDNAADAPASPRPANIGAETGPPLESDVYAINLDLSCEKPYDELTREEAIAVLKSLPLRVHFVPYFTPGAKKTSADEGAEANVDGDGDAKMAESAPCPASGETDVTAKSEAVAPVPEPAPPASPERDCRSTKPRSRKRTRKDDEEADADSCSNAAEDAADPRPKSGGSPVKKKRGDDAA